MVYDDYVERQKLIELGYWHGEPCTIDNPFPDGVDAVDSLDIEELPAADVRPIIHASWEYEEEYDVFSGEKWYRWKCSNCGYPRTQGWEHTKDGRKPDANFCEKCGAMMKE